MEKVVKVGQAIRQKQGCDGKDYVAGDVLAMHGFCNWRAAAWSACLAEGEDSSQVVAP